MRRGIDICEVPGCGGEIYAIYWCRGCYHHMLKWGNPYLGTRGYLGGYYGCIGDRIRYDGDCWIWEGRYDNKGYGRISIGGWRSVQRYVYEQHHFVVLLSNQVIKAACGDKRCVSPEHLYLE